MQTDQILEQRLLAKIRKLVPEQILLVEKFIDSLEIDSVEQENGNFNLTLAVAKLSEPVLQKIWDNPDDAEYDNL